MKDKSKVEKMMQEYLDKINTESWSKADFERFERLVKEGAQDVQRFVEKCGEHRDAYFSERDVLFGIVQSFLVELERQLNFISEADPVDVALKLDNMVSRLKKSTGHLSKALAALSFDE